MTFGRFFVVALFLSALAMAAGTARAQGTLNVPRFSNKLVKGLMDRSRKHITRAKLSNGRTVPPETPAERRRPILSVTEGRTVVKAGYVSAIAEWCGVEWRRASYLKMMRWQRGRRRWSDKQLAFIGLLHGVTMGTFARALRERTPCTDVHRTAVKNYLAGRR